MNNEIVTSVFFFTLVSATVTELFAHGQFAHDLKVKFGFLFFFVGEQSCLPPLHRLLYPL